MEMPVQQTVRQQSFVAMLLIGVAVLIGGGGSPSPWPELVLQVWSALMLGAWALLSPAPIPRAAPLAWTIAALLLVLPVVQLIPLPPTLWHALPGREFERASLALVGADDTWRPWSVAPSRTLAGLLALITPLIVLVMTASLGRSGRTMAMGMVAGMALLSLIVGAGQMTGGDANSLRFYVPDANYLNGFQANHNSTADVLLIGMVGFAAGVREWCERKGEPDRPGLLLGLVAGSTLMFSLGVLLTGSRAGAFLLPVAIVGVVAIVWPWLHFSRKTVRMAAVSIVALVVLAYVMLQTNAAVGRVLSRYDFTGEFRPQLWRDSIYAAREYFPFGAGLGAFVPVFIAIERLEVVDASVPNRAHNEILELAVEGGAAQLVLLALVVILLARRLFEAWRNPPMGSRAHVHFASATFSIVALHSQVDYPLRSMSLACIAAVAVGVLMPEADVSWGRHKRLNGITKEPT